MSANASPEYFVLECLPDDVPVPAGWMVEHYDLKVASGVRGKTWRSGAVFDPKAEFPGDRPPEVPIRIETKRASTGNKLLTVYPELTWQPIPLFSRRLVAALREAGVDNLETFETVLSNLEGEKPPPADFYLAVNVIGLVEAADLKKSELGPGVEEKLISVDFDSLSVDPARARNLLMFRLAENTSAVLVHARVKAQVEAAGLPALTWLRPQEWAG